MRFHTGRAHPDWVANIVAVLKKNEKIRICIDYRDLNAAYPKDEFPLPITDVMIDNTCGFKGMSFMDGSQGTTKLRCTQRTKCWPKGYTLRFIRFDDNKTYKRYLVLIMVQE